MAGTNLELQRQGGRLNVETGQLFTESDADRIGGISLQTLMHLLMLLFYDEDNSTPLTGFPRETPSSDHCLVTATGDLTFDVAAGFGMLFDSSALASDEWYPAAYRPIVVESDHSDTLDAHDATNPRIDIVCLAPAYAADESATRNIKNPSTGVKSTSSVDQRQRLSYALQIVTGTPAATPAEPATPAGYVKIARAEVPASSGAATWTDCRPVLELGHLLKGHPSRLYHTGFVPEGASTELEVSETSPVSLAVEVLRGRAVIDGLSRWYETETLTIAAADPSDPRIDLVVANRDGTLSVETGTPAATPSVPATPANAIPLAQIAVAALAASIGPADVTDVRNRRPFTGDLIELGSMGTDLFETVTRQLNFPCIGMAVHPDSDNPDVDRPPFGATSTLGVRDTTSTGSTYLHQVVQLPHQSTVKALRLHGNTATGSGNAHAQLWRVADDGGAERVAVCSWASGTGDFTVEDTAPTLNEVDTATYGYMLEVAVGNIAAANDFTVYQAEIEFDTAQVFS